MKDKMEKHKQSINDWWNLEYFRFRFHFNRLKSCYVFFLQQTNIRPWSSSIQQKVKTSIRYWKLTETNTIFKRNIINLICENERFPFNYQQGDQHNILERSIQNENIKIGKTAHNSAPDNNISHTATPNRRSPVHYELQNGFSFLPENYYGQN